MAYKLRDDLALQRVVVALPCKPAVEISVVVQRAARNCQGGGLVECMRKKTNIKK
jgi:hypothetical protein